MKKEKAASVIPFYWMLNKHSTHTHTLLSIPIGLLIFYFCDDSIVFEQRSNFRPHSSHLKKLYKYVKKCYKPAKE